MYVCMYVCMYVRMYVRTHVCMYVRMYVRMYVCMYVCTTMYVRTYVCMYVRMYVCMYVWDPYREGQLSALDRVQKKAAKFAHHTNSSNWETLVSRRKLSRICALFKAYSGERAWKAIGDKLQRPHYLSRIDHERKISRRQRTDIGKYSFVNRTIQHWNQLPAEVVGNLPCKPITFKKRVRKMMIELN